MVFDQEPDIIRTGQQYKLNYLPSDYNSVSGITELALMSLKCHKII